MANVITITGSNPGEKSFGWVTEAQEADYLLVCIKIVSGTRTKIYLPVSTRRTG